MARKRMIDPNFWRDEKIAQCVFMERLLFQGLWTLAEDHGAGRANPLLIKADIFPYDTTLREADIEKSLVKLASLGLIILYEIDCQKYYYVVNFAKHQTINKPSKKTIPLPLPEHYGSATVVTTVVVTPEDKLIEVKRSIVEHLNEMTGANYKPTSKSTMSHINARLNEGYALDDFIAVIDKKCSEWMNTDMAKYLRPETLFGAKFEGYLNAGTSVKKEPQRRFIPDGVDDAGNQTGKWEIVEP